MCRDDVKVSVLQREVVGDAAFIADIVPFAFSYLHYTDVCCLFEQITLDKAHEEHLPHLKELVRDCYEATRSHVGFYFTGSLGLILARALLRANSHDIVLLHPIDEIAQSLHRCLVFTAHIPRHVEHLEVTVDMQLALRILLKLWPCFFAFFLWLIDGSGQVE